MAPEDRSSIIKDWTDCFWDMRAKRDVNSSSVREGPEAAIFKIRMVVNRCYWRCVVCHFEKRALTMPSNAARVQQPHLPALDINNILITYLPHIPTKLNGFSRPL